jgi:hypothetical protein
MPGRLVMPSCALISVVARLVMSWGSVARGSVYSTSKIIAEGFWRTCEERERNLYKAVDNHD